MNWHKTSEELPLTHVPVVGRYGLDRDCWYRVMVYTERHGWTFDALMGGVNIAPTRWAYIEEPETCKWTLETLRNGDEYVHTSCGYGLWGDEVDYRRYDFCHHCGKRIELVEPAQDGAEAAEDICWSKCHDASGECSGCQDVPGWKPARDGEQPTVLYLPGGER